MSLFRYSRDAFGQQVLEGISYDLFWLFLGAALGVVIGHLIYRQLNRQRKK